MIQNGCTLFPHFFLRSWCKGRCKKSCTTWDVKNPINSGINHQPQLVQDFFHQQYHYPYVSDLHVISTSPVHPRRCHPRICQVDGHGLSFVQESHILVGRLEDSNHSGLGFSWLLGREVGWRTSPDTVLDSLKKSFDDFNTVFWSYSEGFGGCTNNILQQSQSCKSPWQNGYEFHRILEAGNSWKFLILIMIVVMIYHVGINLCSQVNMINGIAPFHKMGRYQLQMGL